MAVKRWFDFYLYQLTLRVYIALKRGGGSTQATGATVYAKVIINILRFPTLRFSYFYVIATMYHADPAPLIHPFFFLLVQIKQLLITIIKCIPYKIGPHQLILLSALITKICRGWETTLFCNNWTDNYHSGHSFNSSLLHRLNRSTILVSLWLMRSLNIKYQTEE